MSSPDRLNTQEEREKQYALLALKREEIPIARDRWPKRNPTFYGPIHKEVLGLPEKIRFNEQYAEEVFDEVWAQTVEDVEGFISDPENDVGEEEAKNLGRLITYGREYWRSRLSFSPSQDLLLSAQCPPGDALVYPSEQFPAFLIIAPFEKTFSIEKIEAYAGEVGEGEEEMLFRPQALFLTKNLDGIFQAFFLRDWYVSYHNLLLKEALGLGNPE
jgi:hypothetical protein